MPSSNSGTRRVSSGVPSRPASFQWLPTARALARKADGAWPTRVSAGADGSERLAGTPYAVGSDADPDYSPDGRSVVFRRLTATGNGGLGTWDLMTARLDGSALTTIVTGPAFRGAPDWGSRGIVFPETDAAAGAARLVLVQADGSGRQALVTLGSSFEISYPRWLQ